jgi:energy-coupling factor transport system ATP-binding protein
MIVSENLHFTYTMPDEGSVPALPVLSGVNFSVGKGEFIAIVGRNGSGKSTLARHINALLFPASGTMRINRMDTRDESKLWEIRKTVGMVFQNPDNQIIATTVEEDVAFGPENLGIPSEEIRKRVDDALAATTLSDLARHAPHHLSGGQKQRVAIAGVLAMRPDVIVLDESTAMLDPNGRREVLQTVTRLNREEGITLILITHYMDEAILAGRVIVMDGGEIVMDGTPRDVFKQSGELMRLGLAVPQAVVLGKSLREVGVPISEDILTVGDLLGDAALADTDNRKKTLEFIDKMIWDKAILPSNGAAFMELRNLSYTYNPGAVFEKKALSDINLIIHTGEIIGLIGHTGSGKSTLIQHLNALIKPTSGQVLVNGGDIHADKKRLASLRRQVGLVFQFPEHQLFEATVYKDVAFGPLHMGQSDGDADKNVRRALGIVGIQESLFEASPFSLSGGQKRRVAIAGVLAMLPHMLILDEPTAGLDPQGRKEILSQIKKMHEQLGITVLIVSHNMDDIAQLCNRIIVMNQGKLVADAAPHEIFMQSDRLKAIGLEAPQAYRIRALLTASQPPGATP